jgi:hypothetical protein
LETIRHLYTAAELPQPTAARCIVPLGGLIDGANLVCTEIEALTSERVSAYLLGRGAIVEPLSDSGTDRLAGFLYANGAGGGIFVEREDRVTRRRFSAAHELGHFMLHFLPLLQGAGAEALDPEGLTEALLRPTDEEADPSQGRFGSRSSCLLPDQERMEREADRFAAEILMPEGVVRALGARYGSDFQGEDLVWRLSGEMLVSRAAMRWRLKDLGLLALPPRALN